MLEANSGNDTLIAGSGSDTLVGGSADDTLVAGSGTDILEGGAGSTTYVFNSGFGQAEIQPGAGNGTIVFGAGITLSNLKVGLTSDSSGNPALQIQDGNSSITIDGGLNGRISEFAFADGTKLTLPGLLTSAAVMPESLAGSSGNAILDTSAASSLSGSGDDTILGTGASDTLIAGIGDEYLLAAGNEASISGGFGNDTLVGGGAQDTVVAGNGDQQLYGLGAADVLTGGTGDDTLHGGAGPDTLISGAGNTIIYGGSVTDSIVLTAGATTTFYPNGTSSSELIELPIGMTLADFTPYQGVDGDLILQSASNGTTAVIKGFYTSGASGKLWMIADSTGAAQLLSHWLDAQQPSPPSGYRQEIDELRQAFGGGLESTLNQIGQQGGTIQQPGITVTPEPGYQYQFDGVSSQNVTVEGGVATLGSSESDQITSTTLQTGSTTYTVTTPVYGEVTVPGWQQFIPDSSLTQQQIDDMENEPPNNGGSLSVQPGTDSSGNPGFVVASLPSIEYEQTGTKTTVETVPEYTTSTQVTRSFTTYNVTGDGGNDTISVGPIVWDSYGYDVGPYFTGTVNTGNGNVSVNLGMNNWEEYLGDSGTWYAGSPLYPGAFVEAGSGNDTIVGSGGADVIAAGTGFDQIIAAWSSTVYVPLQGASTESIDVVGPYYGYAWDPTSSLVLPASTLVLPAGITEQDLTFRVFDGATDIYDQFQNTEEILQIRYGDSTVLLDFTSVDKNTRFSSGYFPAGFDASDINGIDRIQFSDGATLSRSSLVSMAGPAISVSNLNPVVTAGVTRGNANSAIQGASLFNGYDNTGFEPITWYQVSNTGTGGAYFVLNGVVQTPATTFYVSKDQLADLTYVAGTGGTSDTIKVSAFDGVVWGATTSFNFQASAASLYRATGTNQEVVGGASGPDTLVGGYGGDTLIGSSGKDTFEYNAGGGREIISETVPTTAKSDNVLDFGAGIAPSSLALTISDDPTLVISTGGGGDSVGIAGFDPLNPLQSIPVQSIEFSDGTSLTPLQLLSDSAVTGSSGSIKNADGSVTSYDFTPSGQQIYHAQNVNTSGQLTATVSLNANGSQVMDSYAYAADGTYSDTVVSTPAGGGGSTTTTYGYDASGHLVSEQVKNPDGSSASYTYNDQGQELTGNVTNADGSTSDSTFTYNADGSHSDTVISTPAGSGGSTTTTYGYDASGHLVSEQVKSPDGSSDSYTYNDQGQELTGNVTNADGSTSDSTFTYNADGSHSDTVISTPAGSGGSTTTTYGYDASGHLISEQVKKPDGSIALYTYNDQGQELTGNVTNADGSTSDSTFTYNADGSHSDTVISASAGGVRSTTTTYAYDASGHLVAEQVKNPDGSSASYTYNDQGQELTGNVTNADGSTSDSTFTYNADGSHSDTVISTPAGGSSTTTTYGYDASGHLASEQVENPDGSSASYTYNDQGQELTGNVTNADGSTSDSTFTYNADGSHSDTVISTPAGGSSTTTTYGYDASGHLVSEQVKNPDGSSASYTYNDQGQELTGNVTNADGSTSNSTFTYNADGSRSDTVISTPAGGSSTTTTYGYDASGHLVSEQVKNPDGSSASYTYNEQGQELTGNVTNADGSTSDSMFTYNADGSHSDTVIATPAGGGNSTTTVYDYSSQGGLSNENIYTPSTGGSYTDSWSKTDGSHGAYWWNASTAEYQESWYNSDGSSWTDEYQYAAGGSPAATGYSFLETYDASDGSQGSRQYDSTIGAVALSWDSASTGQLSGTTTDSGFIGLQNESELTNTQPGLTFFNPNVSPSFNAFLAGH